MKRLLLASIAGLALTSGSALAADLYRPAPAYKAPPAPVAVYNWTGCYIDGGVGYGMWNQDHYTETLPGGYPLTESTTTGGRGWLGRVGGGCDYQIASSFVIGAFADYDFMDLHGTFDEPYNYVAGEEKESGSWAVGGRIGYLVTPSLLTYLDGGYTQAHFDQINLSSLAPPSPASGLAIPAHTYNGWFIGGGTEYALGSIIPISGLFWRTEYRYSSYQAADLPVINSATGALYNGCVDEDGACGVHMQKYVQTITSGLVWRFNFGGH